MKLDQILFTMLRYHTTTIRKVIAVEPDEIKGLDDEFVEMDASIPASFQAYRATITSEAEQALWSRYETRWQAYLDTRAAIIRAIATSDHAGAAAAIAPARAPLVAAFDALGAIIKVNDGDARASAAAADAAYRSAWTISIGLMIGSVLILAACTAWIVRSIGVPITSLVTAMKAIVAGDLDRTIPFTGRRDEVGRMAEAAEGFRQASIANRRLEEDADGQRRRAEAARSEIQARAEREAQGRLTAATAGLAEGLSELAAGNLTFQLDTPLAPEFDSLRINLNKAVFQLSSAMTGVVSGAQSINAGSRDINRSTDDLSRRTEQQAANLEETAAALDEIMATVKKTAEGATHARTVVSTAKVDTERSGDVVGRAVAAMNAIERSSREIDQIISVIDEIAFQTNLLALNAGVEAARAGDSGRGFAVVASEVRALAQRSAEAAKGIKSLISASTSQVKEGVELVDDVGRALGRISAQVANINAIVTAIASSAQEQANGLEQVNTAINQIDQVTQQNAAMVEETTAASRSLSQDAENLNQMVERFHIKRKQGSGSAPPPMTGRSPAVRPEVKPYGRGGTALKTVPEASADENWDEF